MNLSNSYDQLVLGKSYVSLVFAIIQKKRFNLESLVVDDKRFKLGDKWTRNIGELERRSLKRLGDELGVDSLSQIDSYLEQTNTIVFLKGKMIEFGASPFANVKELTRKLPEPFSKKFLEDLAAMDAEFFDREMDRYYEMALDEAALRLHSDGGSFFNANAAVEPVLRDMVEGLKKKSPLSKQLHYVLQALFQTLLSNVISETELRFLLAELLSPRFETRSERLEQDLLFAFKNMGGHIKEVEVASFHVKKDKMKKDKMERVVLQSFEGVVKAREFFVFGHFEDKLPFERPSGGLVYRSLMVKCPVEHKFLRHFQKKRILFAPEERMGTDFPHWEARVNKEGLVEATYVYASREGAKSNFYYRKAAEDLFSSLEAVFPGLDKDNWFSRISFEEGPDVWLENINSKLNSKRLQALSDFGGTCLRNGRTIKNLHYFGPLRARFLGFFGYLLNVFHHKGNPVLGFKTSGSFERIKSDEAF